LRQQDPVIIIGAGIGGLAAAMVLAARGIPVLVLERAGAPGGKMRETVVAGQRIDAGPTVFTLKRVFEEIFAAAGASFEDCVPARRAEVLARHAWDDTARLDLFADVQRSADAIGDFAGAQEAKGFLAFCEETRRMWATLEPAFVRKPAPSMGGLLAHSLGGGLGGLKDLLAVRPFTTFWKALEGHFADPRLQQLFGRYATYVGSSPYISPATLMLVAHVEQGGVWLIDGGMHQLAQGMAIVAKLRGAKFRYGSHVAEIITERGRAKAVVLADGERIAASAVVYNGEVAALAAGLLGNAVRASAPPVPASARSLSALTWTMVAETSGFPLLRHSVFFSPAYKAEFDDVFTRHRSPADPTVYVCAQDRDAADGALPQPGPERLLCLINAPPTGDHHAFQNEEIKQCEHRAFATLARCGLTVERRPEAMQATSPSDFNQLFPATGGALYGRASHGSMASFQRPGLRTKVPGLYLAGGSAHPGPGVPMVALSGLMAAQSVLADLGSRKA
jgi:1-hydroxycarotenoid 3,4-desaturase